MTLTDAQKADIEITTDTGALKNTLNFNTCVES